MTIELAYYQIFYRQSFYYIKKSIRYIWLKWKMKSDDIKLVKGFCNFFTYQCKIHVH